MHFAIALALACVLGASVQLDGGVGGESTTRRTNDVGQAPQVGTDLSLAPRVQLGVQSGRGAIGAAYQPRLTFFDVGRNQRREVMHDGRLRLGLAPSAVWNVVAVATGGVGRTDLVTESLRQGQPAGSIPDVISTRQVLAVERAGVALELRTAPTRRAALDFSVAGSMGGGADGASRVFLPVERTATAALEYRYAVTRENRVGLGISGQATRLEQAPGAGGATHSSFGVALASWRHQVTPDVEVRAGAGEAWLRAEVPGPEGKRPRSWFRPAAELGLDVTSLTKGVNGQAVARLWASIDRLTGEVSQQLDGSASLGWALRPNLKLSGRAAAALAWQDSGTSRRGELQVRTDWAVTPLVGAGLGTYGAWQRSPGAPSFVELGVSASLAFEVSPVRWRADE